MLRLPLITGLALVLLTSCGSEPSSIVADTNTDHCATTQTIERPLVTGGAATFAYHYRLVRRGGLGKPVIVLLPGGPGDTSLEFADRDFTMHVLFPDGYDVLLTEPRGVGCNQLPNDLPAGAITSEAIAADVTAALKAEGIGDFIVFGWSYGTMLATVLSSELQTQNLAPRAYVLQGTLGRHFGADLDPYAGFQTEWDKLRATLPASLRDQLSAETLPLGLSAGDWAAFIDNRLLIKDETPLATALAAIDGTPAQQNELKRAVQQVVTENNDLPGGLERLYKTIVCGEISESDNGDFALVGGRLVGHQDPAFCAGRPLAHPFDAASYRMNAPIFYLNGDDDPATTMASARYHLGTQTGSERWLLTVTGAAHYPFGSLAHCRDGLWNAIAATGEGWDAAVAACGPIATSEHHAPSP